MVIEVSASKITITKQDGTSYYQYKTERFGEIEECLLRIAKDQCSEPVEASRLITTDDDSLVVEGGEP